MILDSFFEFFETFFPNVSKMVYLFIFGVDLRGNKAYIIMTHALYLGKMLFLSIQVAIYINSCCFGCFSQCFKNSALGFCELWCKTYVYVLFSSLI